MLNLKHYAYSNACVSVMAVSIVIGSSGKSSTYHAVPNERAKKVLAGFNAIVDII